MYDSFVRDRLPPPELLPEFRFDLPEVHYPERLNSAAELLNGGDPDALAVINDHGRWTYAELDDFSGRIARLLGDQHGLIPGNRVLLRGPNTYTMFAVWLGVLKAGGVVVAASLLVAALATVAAERTTPWPRAVLPGIAALQLAAAAAWLWFSEGFVPPLLYQWL